jgi:hypothetical protein
VSLVNDSAECCVGDAGVVADREGRWVMAAVYRRYCQSAAVIFLLITSYTAITKLAQGRLADDWLHSVLHLCSGLVGI